MEHIRLPMEIEVWSGQAQVVAKRHQAFVYKLDLEGIVAKRRSGVYRPGHRGWTKIKNPGYWRRDQELESMRRSRERSRAA